MTNTTKYNMENKMMENKMMEENILRLSRTKINDQIMPFVFSGKVEIYSVKNYFYNIHPKEDSFKNYQLITNHKKYFVENFDDSHCVVKCNNNVFDKFNIFPFNQYNTRYSYRKKHCTQNVKTQGKYRNK